MVEEENIVPTLAEYTAFINEVASKPSIPYALEWFYAIKSGWNPEEFLCLYANYVKSTQIPLKSTDDATELKGRPLERLAHYFLEKGGTVTSIKEISAPRKWQVDGQGLLNKANILMCWGEEICQKIGFQLYLEAKNHNDPVTNGEFSTHFRRMVEHDCYVGVSVSTSGYRIGRGQGIAQSIHHNYLRNRFHLLLAFDSFRAVVIDRKAPLFILTEALSFSANDSYSNDKDVQRTYAKDFCHKVAQAEYKRLFCSELSAHTNE